MEKHITTDRTDGLTLTDQNEIVFIDAGVNVSSEGEFSVVVQEQALDSNLVVHGTVTNANDAGVGVYAQGCFVEVEADGKIEGATVGVDFRAVASLINYGTVEGQSSGVEFHKRYYHLTNGGTIASHGHAVDILGARGGKIYNVGDGTIVGQEIGIFVENTNNHKTLITNKGEIEGDQFAISCGDGIDRIVNKGILRGDVALGGNDDVLDSHGGGITGAIDLGAGDDRVDLRNRQVVPDDPALVPVKGGEGDDTFTVDDASIVIVEGADGGFDLVRSLATVTLAQNVEALQLLGSKNLDGVGNDGKNLLRGNLGDNHLSGGAGDDRLYGAGGNDRLTGGADSDTFVFQRHNGHDVVTDFSSADDTVSLTDFDIGSYADLKQDHMQDVGDDLVISFGKDTLTLKNTHIADVAKADFQL